jgi:cytoskeletal protein CcmA (bactofilin family)
MKKLLFILIFTALFYGANAQSWNLTGNAGTSSSNFIGTTDDRPLIFKTNNTEHVRILPDGNIGIGTETPAEKLHIKDGSLIISNTVINNPNPIYNLLTFRIDDERTGRPVAAWRLDNLFANEFGLHLSHAMYPFLEPGNSSLFLCINGFIGMGNKNPRSKLDVTGGIYADDATIAGTVTANTLNTHSATITGNTNINGNVGIGTNDPQAKLDVNGSLRAQSADISGRITAEEVMVNNRGSFDGLGTYYLHVVNTSNLRGNVFIGTNSQQANIEVNGLITAQTANILGTLTANALKVPNITGNVSFTGNVGIGISSHNKYKLDVKGTIRAEEVLVCLNQGCDFVFEEDYELMGLEELEKYIKTNKHLPEVAPAAVMEAEGINVSEMSAKLLQKIEELTLYILQQEKKMTDLQHQINELKNW